MTLRRRHVFLAISLSAVVHARESWLDGVSESLAFGTGDGGIRGRLSGSVEVEAFKFSTPVSDLVFAKDDFINPRLVLYLDAQLGRHVYAFGQLRFDRKFDPTDRGRFRPRLDEVALRVTPWVERNLSVQLGQFATVVGQWPRRHAAWENPFVTAPLPYDNLLGIWDRAAATTAGTLLEWSHVVPASGADVVHADRGQRLPMVWGPSYTTGAAVFAGFGRFDLALEVKNASLSSRPKVWNDDGDAWDHPTVSGRLGWRPNAMWNLGWSASAGSYLVPEAEITVRPGHGLGDYRQLHVAQDLSFAWHHWQVWSEIHAARFEIPGVGPADTVAYFVEARYRFGPRWALAARWNQHLFDQIDGGEAGRVRWGREAWRVDVAPAYRFSPHMQLKLQFSLRHEDPAPRAMTRAVSAQWSLRF